MSSHSFTLCSCLLLLLLEHVVSDTTAQQHAQPQRPLQKIAPQPRIVGGQFADPYEYEAFVHGTNGELCGGSLIHPDVVVTAAHCAVAFGGDFLILGATNVYGLDGAPQIPIEFIYPHPDYTPGPEENDIMLIKLGIPVDWVPVVPLHDGSSLAEGQVLRVMGFGRTAENGDISEDLLEVDVNFVPMEQCKVLLPDLLFEESHICAGGDELGGQDSCEGDSGSPLLDAETGVQVGLVSFGVGCGRPNTPGVYTNVHYYLDWIRDFICENSSIQPDYCGQTEEVADDSNTETQDEPVTGVTTVVEEEEDENLSSEEPPANEQPPESEQPPAEEEQPDDTQPEEPSPEEARENQPDGDQTTVTEAPDNGFVSVDLSQFQSSASHTSWHRQLLFVGGSAFLWCCS